MPSLDFERNLLLDRGLRRDMAALDASSPAEAWRRTAEALRIRSLQHLADSVAEEGLRHHPGEADLWRIRIQAGALSPKGLEETRRRLAAEKALSAAEREVLSALVDYYLERDREGLDRLHAVREKDRGALFHEVYGFFAMARQDFAAALKAFQAARRLAPRELRHTFHVARVHHAMGRPARALAWLYRVVSRERHYVTAWDAVAKIHLEAGDRHLAVQAFGMSLSVNPRDWGIYFTFADHYLAENRHDMARACLLSILDLHPREVIAAEVHNYLGYLSYLQGRYAEALPAFRKALELNPSLAVAWFNLGNLYARTRRPDEAVECFRKALEADPRMASAACQLGLTYLDQGILDRAREPLERALHLDPSDPWAHLGLSEYHRKTRNPVGALEEARAALRLAPEDADVHNTLGIALETNRRYFEAEKAYLRALELDPRHRWAANNLGYLREKIMKVDPAYKNAAVEAWKQRLIICRDMGSSMRGALNHLKRLGVPPSTLRRWLEKEPPAGSAAPA